MVRDVILNKRTTIERCLIRIREVYDGNPENLKDFTKQDSIILNIQRAIESVIDISMHLVSTKKLGLPQSSRDALEILNKEGILNDSITNRMKSMIGFRNIAVHDYQKLNLDVIENIINSHLDDFDNFIDEVNNNS